MENKIPLPTDSLYKFVALFSMTIVIGAFYLAFYAGESSNAVVYENWSELASLQSLEKPNAEQAARKEMLERKIEIAVENRKTLVKLAAFLAGGGTLGVYVGFAFWIRKQQKVADQIAENQLELSRLQLLALRHELKGKGVEVDKL
ncbi:hypothetical protein [Pseudomonas aeruginosa]|uniref:hypothetical protein n=1 Tax=Pseudomonas aeruginosa TaxID=287 RepID=UPI0021D7A2E7|nr:hypothetical protein [Pseudomonas aeruginosa]MCU9067768.1 hypothetical protein [Pseudomonas aeruginosa]MCU9117108.1 hypothetical protein [Pseudomonas aeruginosa]MCU9130166.1 hypothetical protein [Pseudomonas aeruginosa]MCU9132145.1 hypothetical protein [Pseudomonas aeruginosa]